jgi:nitrogen fixation protein FixH
MKMQMRVHWGLAIGVVYALFASATVAFVGFALGQPVQVVSADYYARSLTYDQRLEAIRRAEALGADVSVALADDGRALVVTLPRGHRDAIAGTLTWYRPSDDGADRTVPIAPDARGVQRLALTGMRHGRWTLKMEWTSNAERYYREQPVLVP